MMHYFNKFLKIAKRVFTELAILGKNQNIHKLSHSPTRSTLSTNS